MVGFLISNGILVWTLFLATAVSSRLPLYIFGKIEIEWLSVVLASFVTNFFISRSYDLLIFGVHHFLPDAGMKVSFGIAAFVALGIMVSISLGYRVDIPDNVLATSLSSTITWGLIFLCAADLWRLLPPTSEGLGVVGKLVACTLFGPLLFIGAILFPLFVATDIGDFYNVETASFFAGWSAGLAGWLLSRIGFQTDLEELAGAELVKGIVARDIPVAIGAALGYFLFKWIGANSMFYAVIAGVIAAIVARGVSTIFSND